MTDKKPIIEVLDKFAREKTNTNWERYKDAQRRYDSIASSIHLLIMEDLATLAYSEGEKNKEYEKDQYGRNQYNDGFAQGKLAVLEMLDDSALLEGLSNIEHEQWMKWSKTISLQESIGQERIGRWKKLWIPYLELTEQDKDHDRKWAKLVLMVIIERLKSQLKEEAKK